MMPRSWRVLGWAVAVAAVGYCVALSVRGGVRSVPWPVHPPLVAVSILALVVVLAWSVGVWQRVLALFGDASDREAPPFGALLRVWALSSLARYVPGGIWQFVAAGALARTAAIPPARLLGALVVQTALSLLSAAVVGAVAFGAAWTAASAVVAAALVHPAPLRSILRLGRRIAGDRVASALAWRGRWRDGLLLLALHVVGWIGYGISFSLFVRGLVPVIPSTARLVGIAATAFLAGYVVLVAPAGLGVREVALSVLLAPVLGPMAAAVALAARLWTVAAELLLATVAVLARRPTRVR